LSRSTRLLRLLQALRGRRHPVTAARLAEALEVSERTIYRDVADLTAQGAPISGEAGVGYMLRPGLFLPPLMLTEDEVEALLLGLRYVDQRGDAVLKAAGAEALAKIGAVLSPEVQANLAVPLSLPGPTPVSFPDNATPLGELRAAIRAQTRLAIVYEDQDGRRSERVVWPIQLAFMDRARVLATWCELRQDFRAFRTDRIVSAAPVDRYPGRRADLMRRLRDHLDAMAARYQPPDRN
jgi:predicted DNA-binding transcriptional regulator YafY